jgi:hypothetical protein
LAVVVDQHHPARQLVGVPELNSLKIAASSIFENGDLVVEWP